MTDHHDCYSAAEYSDLLARTKRLSDQINAVLNLCDLAERQQPGRLPAVLTEEIRAELDAPLEQELPTGPLQRYPAMCIGEDCKPLGIMRAKDARAALLASGYPPLEYRTCNRLLDVESNRYCEFDGMVDVDTDGSWICPACHRRRVA